ncbi:MAG: SAM-dependent methyltransferase, partial [Limisphaerales bacterium]
LPNKSGQRRKRLEALAEVPGTWAFYESPYRIEKLINELCELYPDSEVVLARELTKLHEEFIRGKAAELPEQLAGRKLKGEFVVLVNASARSGETR